MDRQSAIYRPRRCLATVRGYMTVNLTAMAGTAIETKNRERGENPADYSTMRVENGTMCSSFDRRSLGRQA